MELKAAPNDGLLGVPSSAAWFVLLLLEVKGRSALCVGAMRSESASARLRASSGSLSGHDEHFDMFIF